MGGASLPGMLQLLGPILLDQSFESTFQGLCAPGSNGRADARGRWGTERNVNEIYRSDRKIDYGLVTGPDRDPPVPPPLPDLIQRRCGASTSSNGDYCNVLSRYVAPRSFALCVEVKVYPSYSEWRCR